jgi:hypothetical protein
MGLFDFFKKNDVNHANVEAGMPGKTDQRLHIRHVINDPDLCIVEHEKGGIFRVLNISHFGCLVKPSGEASFVYLAPPFQVSLNLCGRTRDISVLKCEQRKDLWALVFKHDQPESLLLMSDMMAPLASGSTTTAIPSDPAKDGVMTKFRQRFRGDGPFDITLERNATGALVFIMITILSHSGEYASLIWDQGRVITKKAVDNSGVAARMTQTQEADMRLAMTCAAACLSMKFTEGAECARLITAWIHSQIREKEAFPKSS